jgi:hypothetical protein
MNPVFCQVSALPQQLGNEPVFSGLVSGFPELLFERTESPKD